MIKILLFLILSVSFITVFQCNSSDVKKTGDISKKSLYENPYFPVTDGNYWKYTNEGETDESELFLVKAKDTKKNENGIQIKVSSFPFMTKENSEQTLTVKTNGEVEISNYMGSSGIFIPSPENFKQGYEWQFGIFKGYISSTSSDTCRNCYYAIITDGFTFSYEMWYKKDIGIVKWGANRTNPPTLKPAYYILKEYKIN